MEVSAKIVEVLAILVAELQAVLFRLLWRDQCSFWSCFSGYLGTSAPYQDYHTQTQQSGLVPNYQTHMHLGAEERSYVQVRRRRATNGCATSPKGRASPGSTHGHLALSSALNIGAAAVSLGESRPGALPTVRPPETIKDSSILKNH